MKHKNSPETELSFFRLSLIDFLRESHPERLSDTDFINERSDLAAETYSGAIKEGFSYLQAEEMAGEALFRGLHFSKHDTLVGILWNEFADTVPQSQARDTAIRLMPRCERVFSKYELTDDFAATTQYDMLYTELTGTILILFEDGIQ